ATSDRWLPAKLRERFMPELSAASSSQIGSGWRHRRRPTCSPCLDRSEFRLDSLTRAMATQYRFGDFKLLPSERLLFRRGAETTLTARAFELLVAFVERAGQLLAKDELLQRVWAGVVVEEN